jgi:hypothetical protein
MVEEYDGTNAERKTGSLRETSVRGSLACWTMFPENREFITKKRHSNGGLSAAADGDPGRWPIRFTHLNDL